MKKLTLLGRMCVTENYEDLFNKRLEKGRQLLHGAILAKLVDRAHDSVSHFLAHRRAHARVTRYELCQRQGGKDAEQA